MLAWPEVVWLCCPLVVSEASWWPPFWPQTASISSGKSVPPCPTQGSFPPLLSSLGWRPRTQSQICPDALPGRSGQYILVVCLFSPLLYGGDSNPCFSTCSRPYSLLSKCCPIYLFVSATSMPVPRISFPAQGSDRSFKIFHPASGPLHIPFPLPLPISA